MDLATRVTSHAHTRPKVPNESARQRCFVTGNAIFIKATCSCQQVELAFWCRSRHERDIDGESSLLKALWNQVAAPLTPVERRPVLHGSASRVRQLGG